MKKTDREYEYLMKRLIEANIKKIAWAGMGADDCCWLLKYADKEFNVTFHVETNYNMVLDYFYQQIMSEKFNEVN
jgi:hypothetical protein